MNNTPPDKETTTAFRQAFSGPAGERVLRHIMIELGMFTPAAADDIEAAALNQFGFRLLELCGVWHEANATNVVNSLIRTTDINHLIKKDKEDE